MDNLTIKLYQLYQKLVEFVQLEKKYIKEENIEELSQLLEKKGTIMVEIDKLRLSSNLKFPLDREENMELYDLIVRLKEIEDENILLMQESVDNLRKRRQDSQSITDKLNKYTQYNMYKNQGIPKFFDKKK